MTLSDTTGDILDAAIKVHRMFGPGLLESVYEKVLATLKEGFIRVVNNLVDDPAPAQPCAEKLPQRTLRAQSHTATQDRAPVSAIPATSAGEIPCAPASTLVSAPFTNIAARIPHP